MFKSFTKIYLILLLVLVVLVVAIRLFPKRQEKEEAVTPTPVQVGPKRAYETPPPLVVPTSTGGSEEIASSEAIAALEKQALRKRTPFAETVFNVSFDYSNDNFIVTLNEPKDINKQVFSDWLKENYPLISLNEFVFK